MRTGVLAPWIGLALVVAGCGGDDGGDGGSAGEEPAEGGDGPTVTAGGDLTFDPAELTAAVGDTVTWVHEGDAPHTVTADDGSFDSGQLTDGASFEHTFDEAGSFAYACEVHPSMTGTVEVAG